MVTGSQFNVVGREENLLGATHAVNSIVCDGSASAWAFGWGLATPCVCSSGGAAFGHDGAIGEGIVLGNAIKKSVQLRTGVPDQCNSSVSTKISPIKSLAFTS
eukprot:scaffold108757_cov60-Cyclotella_meneghiniana.AAC.9